VRCGMFVREVANVDAERAAIHNANGEVKSVASSRAPRPLASSELSSLLCCHAGPKVPMKPMDIWRREFIEHVPDRGNGRSVAFCLFGALCCLLPQS
jgi:hypothetical protein